MLCTVYETERGMNSGLTDRTIGSFVPDQQHQCPEQSQPDPDAKSKVLSVGIGIGKDDGQKEPTGEPEEQRYLRSDRYSRCERFHAALTLARRFAHAGRSTRFAAAKCGSARSIIVMVAVKDTRKYPGIAKIVPGKTKVWCSASRAANAMSSGSGLLATM